MSQYLKRFGLTVISSLIISMLPSLCGAQTAWTDRASKPGLGLEFYKIAVNQSEFFSSMTSVTFLSGRFRLFEAVDFVAEIPVAYSGYTGSWRRSPDFFRDSIYWWESAEQDMIVGNIYLGVDLESSDGGVTFDIGFRLPIAPNSTPNTSVIGTAASIDRWGAFIPETWTLSTALGQRKVLSSGFAYQCRGNLMMQKPRGYGASPEFYFLYGGRIGYQDSLFSMLIGLRGLYGNITGDGDFGRMTMHSLEGILSVSLGHFRPGFRVLWPLDEDQTVIYDKSYGLTVAYDFH